MVVDIYDERADIVSVFISTSKCFPSLSRKLFNKFLCYLCDDSIFHERYFFFAFSIWLLPQISHYFEKSCLIWLFISQNGANIWTKSWIGWLIYLNTFLFYYFLYVIMFLSGQYIFVLEKTTFLLMNAVVEKNFFSRFIWKTAFDLILRLL